MGHPATAKWRRRARRLAAVGALAMALLAGDVQGVEANVAECLVMGDRSFKEELATSSLLEKQSPPPIDLTGGPLSIAWGIHTSRSCRSQLTQQLLNLLHRGDGGGGGALVETPRYRQNAAGQAIVRLHGTDIVLGPYGSRDSYLEYRRIVAEWRSGVTQAPEELTISELADRFEAWARAHYSRTKEPEKIDFSLRVVRQLYGHRPVESFDVNALRVVRDQFVRAGNARSTVNMRVNVIRRLFCWAESHGLAPRGTKENLDSLAALKRGRSNAVETERVRPVSRDDVARTLPHLSRVVGDMVRLQLRTGMRPGEVVVIRSLDIHNTADRVWMYLPLAHKTSHLGRRREIWIGPRSQRVIRKYIALASSPSEFLFRPELAPRARVYGNCYSVASYRRAIKRAAANAQVPIWSPNRLRHTAATELRRLYGIEAARTVLGHSTASTTEIYAETNRDRAIEIADERG